MNRGAWEITVHGVAESQTQLSNFHFHFATQIGGKPLLVEPLGTAGPRGQHLHDPQCLGGDDSEGYSWSTQTTDTSGKMLLRKE